MLRKTNNTQTKAITPNHFLSIFQHPTRRNTSICIRIVSIIYYTSRKRSELPFN